MNGPQHRPWDPPEGKNSCVHISQLTTTDSWNSHTFFDSWMLKEKFYSLLNCHIWKKTPHDKQRSLLLHYILPIFIFQQQWSQEDLKCPYFTTTEEILHGLENIDTKLINSSWFRKRPSLYKYKILNSLLSDKILKKGGH